MERLKGSIILIGREPQKSTLFFAVKLPNGAAKGGEVAAAGRVPNSVSRCIPSQGKSHCTLTIDHNGQMTLTNSNPVNITMVDGMEIASKHVTPSSNVTIGGEHFRLPLQALLEQVKACVAPRIQSQQPGAQGAQAPKEYSIAGLQILFDEYEEEIAEVDKRQRNINLLRSFSPILTIGAGVIAGVVPQGRPITISISVIGLLLMIVSFLWGAKSNPIEEKKKIKKRYEDAFICPNPQCRRPQVLRNPGDMVKMGLGCPNCKCKYTL